MLLKIAVVLMVVFLLAGTSRATDPFPTAARKILEQFERANGTLGGMHDTIGGELSDGFDVVSNVCGERLNLWSSDFGYSTHPNDSIWLRSALLNKIRGIHKQNILITLSWHQCNPTIDEPCTFADGLQKLLSESEWKELLTEGSPFNKKWKGQVDRLGGFLATLQSEGIPVLLRPYHEANFPCYWWHHTDARYFKALWNQLRNHFMAAHNLKNLLWVWSVSYQANHWDRVADYYPGDDAVDIVGLDIYPPGHDKAPDFEKAWTTLKRIAPDKPLALTEISRLPSSLELELRNWAYVVPWGKSMLFRDNSMAEIRAYCGAVQRPARAQDLLLGTGR